MKVRGNITFTLVILTIFLMFSTKSYSFTKLSTCFSEAGAELTKYYTEGSAILDTSDSPETAAYKILDSFADKKEANGYWDNQIYTVKFSNRDIDLTIKTRDVETKKKIYTSVEVSQYKDSMNINNVWKDVAESFSIYRVQPSCSLLICGKFNSRLTIDEMKKKVKEIFLNNKIKTVDEMSDKNMISVCGYIPGINDYILDGGKKVNINIALRYSDTYGCTYISIGSPIIAVEY